MLFSQFPPFDLYKEINIKYITHKTGYIPNTLPIHTVESSYRGTRENSQDTSPGHEKVHS